jgi:CubicO group peptidase (beta-lactamase class C family)
MLPDGAAGSLLTGTEGRRTIVKTMLANPPSSNPGTKTVYSNVGYMIAGAMAEQITSTPWESLMYEQLFEPLGMNSAGFGDPTTAGSTDHPCGHVIDQTGRFVSFSPDYELFASPAGLVHCSLADWAKFVSLHLGGAKGRARLLKPTTFRHLHAPAGTVGADEIVHPGTTYASGWSVNSEPWTGGTGYVFSGYTGAWWAQTGFAPRRNLAFFVAVNAGGEAGPKAGVEATGALIMHFERRFARR